MTPSPTSLATRRRLAKAAAILNDPTHPQHTLLADLVDTALALDPSDGFVPWLEADDGIDRARKAVERVLVALDRYGVAPYIEPGEGVARRPRPWPTVMPS